MIYELQPLRLQSGWKIYQILKNGFVMIFLINVFKFRLVYRRNLE